MTQPRKDTPKLPPADSQAGKLIREHLADLRTIHAQAAWAAREKTDSVRSYWERF